MRSFCFVLLASLAAQPVYANDAFERLKAKYKALQDGQATLPSLTESALSPKAAANNTQLISRPEDLSGTIPAGEELILGVQLGKLVLGQVFGFKTEVGAKLSLFDMTQAFDFAIETDFDNESASGWIRNPNNTFTLSHLEDGTWSVTTNGRSSIISAEKIDLEDDFYIELGLYEKWFDVNFNADYGTLTLKTQSNRPLPIEEKLAREQRAKNTYRTRNEARAPLQKHDYQPISKPLLDIQASVNASESSDTSHNISVLGSNDLAYFNTQYYFAINDENEVNSARLSGSRYSNDADLLGFLNATTIEFGDIRSTQINPLQKNNTFLGARFSNTPLSYNGGNSINLIGNIQAGWDVEVYRNQLLLTSQFNVTDGQYEFQNLPLVFGYNEIELVFYGPQGQVNRENRSYYVSSTGQSAGEFVYDISFVDEGERLFDQNTLNDSDKNGLSTLIRADYGVTDWWSLSIGSQIHHEQGFEQYDQQSFGSDISLFGEALLSIDSLEQDNGDYERRYQVDTSLWDQSLSFIHRENQRTNRDDGDINSFESQELRLSGAIPSLKLSYQQSIEQITPDNEEEYLRFTNQIGTSIGNSYFSNRFSWVDRDEGETTGDWQVQRYLNDFFWRFGNDYTLSPDFDIQSFFTEISGDMSDNTSGRVRWIYDLENDASETTLIASWQPNEFSLTSNFSYNDRTGWRASLLGRVGIGLTQNNSTFFTRMPVSSQGTLSTRVFLDNNRNGRFDLGDRPLSNVEVETLQSYRKATTNSQGVAVLTALPSYQQTDIDIDLRQLDDPYLIRADQGVSIAPRPGSVQTLDIPVVPSLEIEGYVKELQQNGNLANKARVPVLLKDASGTVIKEVTSEFDGYFLITEIVPKAYTLEIDPVYLRNFKFQQGTQIPLTGAESGILAEQNLILRKSFGVHGYSAQLASFSRLESLRGYWRILTKRLPEITQYRYFYNQTAAGYQLYVGFSEDNQEANSLCTLLTENGVDCAVTGITRR
ncbi:SPOR domain-containing protein [Marinomonas gallaica]|uniref:SPOR domain-containing protein n=1 Tax=Marinomonas gallaica TaxID=1806667 RepID=UPI003CE5A9A8